MISRRQFIFDIAAGTAALSTSPSIAGQMGSALLSPAPVSVAATAPAFASSLVLGHHDLLALMRDLARREVTRFEFKPIGHDLYDTDIWRQGLESVVLYSVQDLVDLMRASKIQDLDAARSDTRRKCIEIKEGYLSGTMHPINYDAPLEMMDKFTSHETIMEQISETLERTLREITHAEIFKPAGLQLRPVSMDNMYMTILLWGYPKLQNATHFTGRGSLFAENREGFYYAFTADNLKFMAELEFLHQNHFLSRTFTLPQKEQSILDIAEANPASWSALLDRERCTSLNLKGTMDLLNTAFPERAKNAEAYKATLEKMRNDINNAPLPAIEIPWDIVVQMQNKPDAFVPLMQKAIEDRKQYLSKIHRENLVASCKGKTTFTQTAPRETGFQGLQGTLRGFFAVYPDKENIFNMLKNSFSAAVNLRIDGDDILLEAKPEMNKDDRLLIENLSGKDEAIPVFQQVLPQTLPVIMANAPAGRRMF